MDESEKIECINRLFMEAITQPLIHKDLSVLERRIFSDEFYEAEKEIIDMLPDDSYSGDFVRRLLGELILSGAFLHSGIGNAINLKKNGNKSIEELRAVNRKHHTDMLLSKSRSKGGKSNKNQRAFDEMLKWWKKWHKNSSLYENQERYIEAMMDKAEVGRSTVTRNIKEIKKLCQN